MPKIGGKRPGAGRKPGSANRRTREIADAASVAGLTPLEWMLAVLRDESADVRRRDEMARSAAPYMHPRLTAVEHHGKEDEPKPRGYDVRITYVHGGPDPDAPTPAQELRDMRPSIGDRKFAGDGIA
jgi:hypothetical protein